MYMAVIYLYMGYTEGPFYFDGLVFIQRVYVFFFRGEYMTISVAYRIVEY